MVSDFIFVLLMTWRQHPYALAFPLERDILSHKAWTSVNRFELGPTMKTAVKKASLSTPRTWKSDLPTVLSQPHRSKAWSFLINAHWRSTDYNSANVAVSAVDKLIRRGRLQTSDNIIIWWLPPVFWQYSSIYFRCWWAWIHIDLL